MSAFHGIVCDYRHCLERFGSSGKSASGTRIEAAAAGWKVKGSNTVWDLCPNHADCKAVAR